ncbi:MAG TPA: tRNA (adenosine(37)-N6)-dimethylallyltransferase MiaA [Chitinophagaceae bacterium]|nr:tRNA (adenosine(37)-N6)-dimethylallyltransferase MiaA [Chitinophagaceae bacterium]
MRNQVIVITGPTASGKTEVASNLARYFRTGVISADSRQCYRELTIGTAKPSAALLAEIPHYFINSHQISDQVNAGVFAHFAQKSILDIFRESPVALLCGGTGLYIRAFCEGLDDMPEIPVAIRNRLREQYQSEGLSWLQQEVQRLDPIFYGNTDIRNPHRLLRALEVVETTGISVTRYRKAMRADKEFDLLKIGLMLPGDLLKGRINQRVDQMAESGLRQEVENLLAFRLHHALQTVGYQEMFAFLEGSLSWAKTLELIKIHTWQYARRQYTWLKKDNQIKWVDARHEDHIWQLVRGFTGR